MAIRTDFPFFRGIFFPQMSQVCIVPTLFAAVRPWEITTRGLEFRSAFAHAEGFYSLSAQQSNAKFIEFIFCLHNFCLCDICPGFTDNVYPLG